VGIENEDAGLVVGLHEFLDDDTGEVAFACSRAGDNGEMGAHEVSDGEHDRHGIGRTRQERTDGSGAILSCLPAAQNAGEHVIVGEKDLFARLRRNPGIDEGAGGLFVVAHNGDMQFKQLVGQRIVAHHGGDLGGRDLRFREKGVGVELQGHALEDATEHAAREGRIAVQARFGTWIGEFVVDVFAVLENLLVVTRDEGIFVSGLARSLGDTNRSAGCARG